MADFQYYLDEMPGETRGIVVSDDRIHSLYIERDSDTPQHRLGAQSVGRITRIEPGLRAAFVDMGCGEPYGFMGLGKNQRFSEGEKVLVEVTAEPREAKGPALKRLGNADGEPRLVKPAPRVREILESLAGSNPVRMGLEAIEMAIHAEEEASAAQVLRPEYGLDLSVQRTRALIAADIDYAPLPGKDSRKGRGAVNKHGLFEVARLLRLRHWAGTVVVDLAGVGFVDDSILTTAKSAFSTFESVSFGPLSRFGLLQFSLPWRYQPIDERLAHPATAGFNAVRELRRALLTDTASPVYELVCGAGEAAVLAPAVRSLGPRARLCADGKPGQYIIREG